MEQCRTIMMVMYRTFRRATEMVVNVQDITTAVAQIIKDYGVGEVIKLVVYEVTTNNRKSTVE